jgi:alpha-glucuronidase
MWRRSWCLYSLVFVFMFAAACALLCGVLCDTVLRCGCIVGTLHVVERPRCELGGKNHWTQHETGIAQGFAKVSVALFSLVFVFCWLQLNVPH